MIHLKHKDHGYHIAYSEAEAKICEKSGWTKCDIAKEHAIARKAKEAAKDLITAERKLGEEIAKQAPKPKRKRRTKAEMELANDKSTTD